MNELYYVPDVACILTLYRPYAPYDVFLQFPQTTGMHHMAYFTHRLGISCCSWLRIQFFTLKHYI